jgi:hypothetical protein
MKHKMMLGRQDLFFFGVKNLVDNTRPKELNETKNQQHVCPPHFIGSIIGNVKKQQMR